MKKKNKCPICGKKMFFDKEKKDFICRRCGYPDTETIVAWQKRHKEAQKPINIFRIMTDRLTGKETVFIKKGKDETIKKRITG